MPRSASAVARAPCGRSARQDVFHLTPTSCSWLNAVEGFFSKLTRRRLKRGVFRSIVELQAAINRFLADLKPFVLAAPAKAVPGTTMMVAVPSASDRADIIAYRKTIGTH